MYEAQQKRAELSKLSKQIGAFKNDKQKMQELKDKASQLKKDVVDLEKVADDFDKNAYEILIRVPNISLRFSSSGKRWKWQSCDTNIW
nr:hypothetical protein [Mycoplasmopsis bovis]